MELRERLISGSGGLLKGAGEGRCLTLRIAMIFCSRSLGGNGISHHWTGKHWQRDSKTLNG